MSINFEEEYKTIKKQYDSLLQKNQNDVIKIKQREKALSEELQKLIKQKGETEANHLKIIEGLTRDLQNQKQANTKGKLTVQVATNDQERINELEMDARRLIDQNITLTSQNKSNKEDLHRYQQINEHQKEQIEKLKDYIASLQKDAKSIKVNPKIHNDNDSQTDLQVVPEASFKALKQKLQKLQDQLTRTQNAAKQLKGRIRAAEEENKVISQRQKKSMALFRRKQTQLASIQAELDKAKSSLRGKKKPTQNNQSLCVRCAEYEQEIHLLKQMVKSTKGMVRVKQIQVEKYRIHEEVALRDNKSVGRINQKNLLPPLKKKHGQ